ncbi:hypothetical protein SNN70_004250 [Cronobacter malonaticus]|nr:hypothetical protein [Cronobacter malonaticus]
MFSLDGFVNRLVEKTTKVTPLAKSIPFIIFLLRKSNPEIIKSKKQFRMGIEVHGNKIFRLGYSSMNG